MQEFSSISVSSYEAGALADQLSEQSRAGWSVVAIVPTGSTITAYLSRDADGADAADGADTSAVAVPPTATESTVAAGSDAPPAEHGSEVPTDPVAEAPGWAAGSRDTDDTPSSTVSGEHFTVADEPAAEPAAAEPAQADMNATTSAAADAGAAPAGWYADPSSRFELRYWDGGQWTEHVSRAGQQYTDPPVA